MLSEKTERKKIMQLFNQPSNGRKKIFADITLILCIIFVALSVFLIILLTQDDGAYVKVRVGESTEEYYPLSEDRVVPLASGKNILIIKDGKAYISYADCPEKTCVRTGEISKTGEKIVCLPNMVYVSVVGEEEVLR